MKATLCNCPKLSLSIRVFISDRVPTILLRSALRIEFSHQGCRFRLRVTSVRRFFARFETVVFGATGFAPPIPLA